MPSDNHPLDIIDRLFKKAASCGVAPVTALHLGGEVGVMLGGSRS